MSRRGLIRRRTMDLYWVCHQRMMGKCSVVLGMREEKGQEPGASEYKPRGRGVPRIKKESAPESVVSGKDVQVARDLGKHTEILEDKR